MASAQAATDSFFTNCPTFPAQESSTLQWEPIRAPGMLFCRALRSDGSEVFALTFSRESPFNPRGTDRAEVGYFKGQPIQWYQGNVATAPNALIRETLIDFGDNHVLHISMRAKDQQTLANQQRLVLALSYSQQRLAGTGN